MKKVAKVILYKKGKVLLQLRDNKSNIPFPNQWSLFGGLIEENETAKDCIIREIEEELGTKLRNLIFIGKQTRKENEKIVEDNLFSAEIIKETSKLELHEGSKMQLFSFEELNKIDIVEHYKKYLIDFLRDNN